MSHSPSPQNRNGKYHSTKRYRAFTTVGMKVVFAMLCKPELAEANYRTLAKVADVALGTVGPVIEDLANRGYLVKREKKKALVHTKKLMEDWVARFPDTLRPKLLKKRYQADRDRLLAINLGEHHACWGAEVAAQRLTGYLKPELLCAAKPMPFSRKPGCVLTPMAIGDLAEVLGSSARPSLS